MKRAFLLCLAMSAAALAQRPTAEQPLWPNGAPLATGTDPARDIPSLTPFFPADDKATGASIVICPGGGYGGLAGHEGKDYALFLAEHGVAGFVLKYRLGSAGYRHPVEMYDVQRAIRTVRANAAAWGLDPKRIGVMGSSAGGHLASTAATHFDAGDANAADPIDRAGCRPDLAVLCYPVITMGANTHGGSKANLLGPNPTPELEKLLSSELQVTKDTPPCFVWHTFEDKGVKIENALSFVSALQANGVPFDFHVYQKGGHGLGLGLRDYTPEKEPQLHPWTRDLLVWLKVQGFVK